MHACIYRFIHPSIHTYLPACLPTYLARSLNIFRDQTKMKYFFIKTASKLYQLYQSKKSYMLKDLYLQLPK